MATTCTLSGNLSDLVGGQSMTTLRVTLVPSQQLIALAADQQVRLGSKQVVVDSLGHFSVSGIPVTGTTVQGYRLEVSYRDDTLRSRVQMAPSPWFALTGNTDLATALQTPVSTYPSASTYPST